LSILGAILGCNGPLVFNGMKSGMTWAIVLKLRLNSRHAGNCNRLYSFASDGLRRRRVACIPRARMKVSPLRRTKMQLFVENSKSLDEKRYDSVINALAAC
jgi:hypothetical protein